MGKKELLKKEIRLARNIMVLIGVVWFASLALFINTISGFGGIGMVTGNLVAGEAAMEAAPPSMPSLVSAGVYFLGLILLGGAMFVVSKHTQELRTILKMDQKVRVTTGTPKQALIDFFTILSTWSIKNTSPDMVVANLDCVKEAEKKELPSISGVSFSLSRDDDIEIDVKCNPTWDEVREIFRAYLLQTGVDKDKVINIADYLGKNDVGAVLYSTEVDAAMAVEPEKSEEKDPAPSKRTKSKKVESSPKKKVKARNKR